MPCTFGAFIGRPEPRVEPATEVADEEGEEQSGRDPATENLVEIVDSGIIEVTEEAIDDEEEDGNEDDEEEEETVANTYNTDIERYSKILSDGDSIRVNS